MSDADDLVATLSDAGLTLPPLLGLQTSIHSQGHWQWGTQPCNRRALYMFDVNGAVAAVRKNSELFMLSHGGHGVNSYGLNLVLSKGPLAAYVQHAFGGVYSDPARDKEQIAATYSRLHDLWNDLADTPGPARQLLLHSTFRGVYSLVDLSAPDHEPWHDHCEDFPDEPALLAATTARLAASTPCHGKPQ